MGATFAEKIFSARTGGRRVRPGDIISVSPDVVMTLDADAEVMERFRELGCTRVWEPSRIVCSLDHYAPASTLRTAALHREMRAFAREQGIRRFFEVGEGLTHQIMLEEGYVRPGQFVVGSDSHTPSYGCIGAFSCGMGASDMLSIWATGQLWFQVPESVRIELYGQLPRGVFAKDVILEVIRDFTSVGCTYRCVEFSGEAVSAMSMMERFVLANMAVEMGVKASYVQVDATTEAYARRHPGVYQPVFPDPDAEYATVRRLDVSMLTPRVACPHSVDNVHPVEAIEGREIHQAFIGTCASGKLEDFAVAARILKDRHVAPGVRLLIAPASRRVLTEAVAQGYFQTLLAAGATFLSPGCGPCAGIHEGLIAEGERCISTGPRNFKGRMGSPAAEIYLASTATVAASALRGAIADPRGTLV